jgi:RecB family exonuclease
METGLDPSTRGRLYHKALEIAVSRSLDAENIRAATLENLEQAFAEAELDEKVNLPILPNWEVERREQLRELRKAVESPDFIAPEARVAGVEREFQAEWEGFRLRGTIDRIDETSSGLIAIDYKTSGQVPKGAKDPSGKLTVDVQIPLYSRVALGKLFPDADVGTSVYYSLTKGKVLRAEQEGDMERLSGLAGFLRRILRDGSFAVDPDVQEKACTYCDFETVCRKGPRLKRKRRAG